MTIAVKKCIAILLFLCLLQLSFGSFSFAETEVEAKVKAAFVVNFARFINWPQSSFTDPTAPLILCTVGVEGVEQSFAGVEAKKIKGRPLVLQNYGSLEEVVSSSCQIVYVKGTTGKRLQRFLKENRSTPIVSISESDGFTRLGGIIEFVKSKGRLSFKINNSEAKEKQLQIDAALLNLAEEVN